MIDLPPIIQRCRYSSEEEYFKAVYGLFIHDFIDYPPKLLNKPVVVLRDMLSEKNVYNTFWHLITEGKHTVDDKLDHARMEKLPWINPIINNQPDSSCYMWKKQAKRNRIRTLIYYFSKRYLVVIEHKSKTNETTGVTEQINTFWTAYPVNEEHTHRKLIKEYGMILQK